MIELTDWLMKYWIATTIVLLVEYVIVMKIARWAEGTDYEGLVKYTVAPVFIIQDWWVNVLYSVPMMDPPGTWNELVTGRMKRYKKKYSYTDYSNYNLAEKWRLNYAMWLCKLLNKHDPEHC